MEARSRRLGTEVTPGAFDLGPHYYFKGEGGLLVVVTGGAKMRRGRSLLVCAKGEAGTGTSVLVPMQRNIEHIRCEDVGG